MDSFEQEPFEYRVRRIHWYDTSADAYNATQTDPSVKTGDLIIVIEEAVCGIAWTWPVAVTVCTGALHSMEAADRGAISDLMTSFPITADQLRAAITLAKRLDFPVDPVLEQLARQPDHQP